MKIKSIRNKTISLNDLWNSVSSSYETPHPLDGTTKPLLIDVLTKDGTFKTDFIYRSFADTVTLVMDDDVTLECTLTHKLYTSDSLWVEADLIEIGSRVQCLDREKVVTHKFYSVEPREVMDISVPGPRSYYANSIVSHNSLLAGQIARNQATIGYKVGVVPLEMSIKEMTGRALSSWSGIDNTKVILKRTVENERELIRKKFKRAEKKIIAAGGKLVMYKPKEDQTIQEVFATIHSLNLDIIYIDYISLLKGADTEDQWRQLGIIARYAKIYADAHNKAIVLLCQVNEDGKIRYSQAIKEHAATAWVFGSSGKELGIMNIQALKARNQDASPFTLKVDYPSQSVREFTAEELDQLSNNQSTGAVNNTKRRKAGTDENDRTSKRKSSDDEYMPNLSD